MIFYVVLIDNNAKYLLELRDVATSILPKYIECASILVHIKLIMFKGKLLYCNRSIAFALPTTCTDELQPKIRPANGKQ